MEEDNIVLAKDIEDCDSCPLKDHDCPGGWTSGGSGQPIEPPCCSWNDDTEVGCRICHHIHDLLALIGREQEGLGCAAADVKAADAEVEVVANELFELLFVDAVVFVKRREKRRENAVEVRIITTFAAINSSPN